MLVSIVINNYNYARYVAATIDSALAQTWHPLEVIVVDDGSTDDSWSVIEGYGDRVRAIQQPNGGQGAAYNAGFAASRGEWVMFLDSDDLLDCGALACMLSCADDQVAKVQGYLRRIDADGHPRGGAVPYYAHVAVERQPVPPQRDRAVLPAAGTPLAPQRRHRPEFAVRVPRPRGHRARHDRLLSVAHTRRSALRPGRQHGPFGRWRAEAIGQPPRAGG